MGSIGKSWIEGYSQIPNIWIKLVACIQNLSELKVVLYILRHTWGFQEYDMPKHITTDEFVYGRKRRDGSRMDIGTGLCERSVINGLALAERHGFIVCEINASDLARTKKAYKLKMQAPTMQGGDLQRVQSEMEIVQIGTKEYADRSKNEPENEPLEQTEEIRIVHSSQKTEGSRPDIRGIPLNIKTFITDFTYDLGDDSENLRSNMTRANRIYQSSGISLDDFLDEMYMARKVAKKTAIKKKNKKAELTACPTFSVALKPPYNNL
jgi:hypothetical protein